MHIQTVLKTVLENRRHDYYSIVRKASEILDEDDLCKMAALLVAILTYRKGNIDPTIMEFAAKCLNKYPNLIHAFTRIGVNPPRAMGRIDSDNSGVGSGNKKPTG